MYASIFLFFCMLYNKDILVYILAEIIIYNEIVI